MSLPPKIMSQGGMALSFPTLVTAKSTCVCTFFNEDFEFAVHHLIFGDIFEEGWNND
jgi:fido (protein-threonine AMPylation protein)